MTCDVFWRALRVSQNTHKDFFPAKSFYSFLIRREKQTRQRSVAGAADWLISLFLQYKITNCPNNRTVSQDICTLFARYYYTSLCSWIMNMFIVLIFYLFYRAASSRVQITCESGTNIPLLHSYMNYVTVMRIMNNWLDALVCCFAEYFCLLFVFWFAL